MKYRTAVFPYFPFLPYFTVAIHSNSDDPTLNPPNQPPTPPHSDPPDDPGSEDMPRRELPENVPGLGERLDSFYRSRKEAGDLQTTEIPISMLMALDRLAKKAKEENDAKQASGGAAPAAKKQ